MDEYLKRRLEQERMAELGARALPAFKKPGPGQVTVEGVPQRQRVTVPRASQVQWTGPEREGRRVETALRASQLPGAPTMGFQHLSPEDQRAVVEMSERSQSGHDPDVDDIPWHEDTPEELARQEALRKIIQGR